jgi:uncharacterized phiE125 gp8 family phage protein
MPNALRMMVGPSVEPISLPMAKAHLRVDYVEEDLLIEALIGAAREYAENYCNRAFYNQTWQLTLDAFPSVSSFSSIPPSGLETWLTTGPFFDAFAIKLPIGYVDSITSITYFDGTSIQTLPPAAYATDLNSTPARIMTVTGKSWPYPAIYTPGTVKVTYVAASYGDGVELDTCPMSIKQALLLLIGHYYTNRESVSSGTMTKVPQGVESLLNPYKIYSLGI